MSKTNTLSTVGRSQFLANPSVILGTERRTPSDYLRTLTELGYGHNHAVNEVFLHSNFEIGERKGKFPLKLLSKEDLGLPSSHRLMYTDLMECLRSSRDLGFCTKETGAEIRIQYCDDNFEGKTLYVVSQPLPDLAENSRVFALGAHPEDEEDKITCSFGKRRTREWSKWFNASEIGLNHRFEDGCLFVFAEIEVD